MAAKSGIGLSRNLLLVSCAGHCRLPARGGRGGGGDWQGGRQAGRGGARGLTPPAVHSCHKASASRGSNVRTSKAEIVGESSQQGAPPPPTPTALAAAWQRAQRVSRRSHSGPYVGMQRYASHSTARFSALILALFALPRCHANDLSSRCRLARLKDRRIRSSLRRRGRGHLERDSRRASTGWRGAAGLAVRAALPTTPLHRGPLASITRCGGRQSPAPSAHSCAAGRRWGRGRQAQLGGRIDTRASPAA